MAKIKKTILIILAVLLCMLCISGVVMLVRNFAKETPADGTIYVQALEFDTNTINFNIAG